jgi:hypothetical protein
VSEIVESPYPKRGIFDERGNLSKAGEEWLASLGRRTEPRARTAAGVMGGGNSLIQSRGLWATMNGATSQGSGLFRPDLSLSLRHHFFLTGATVVGPPLNPPGTAQLYWDIVFHQDANGGRPVTFSAEFEGEPPILFEGPNDRTLCGFTYTSRAPDRFTGWSIKGIVAAA